jgi:flagellar motor switch protein FliN/FliY
MQDPAKQDHDAPDALPADVTGQDIDALVAAAAGGEHASPGPSHGPHSAQESETLDLPDFGGKGPRAADSKRISMLNDVKLNVKIELGRTRMLVEEVLKLGEGSVVELDKPAGDPVEVYVNDRLVGRGEVLVLNDNFCVRISEVLAADPHRVST